MVVKSWLEVWSSSGLRVGVIEPAVGSMNAMVVGGGWWWWWSGERLEEVMLVMMPRQASLNSVRRAQARNGQH